MAAVEERGVRAFGVMLAAAVFMTGCERSTPEARVDEAKAEIARISDEIRASPREATAQELEDLRVNAVALMDLTGDSSAVVLWAITTNLVKQDQLGAKQEVLLDEFRSLGGHDPSAYATAAEMRRGVELIDALHADLEAYIEHQTQRPASLERMLDGLPDEQVATVLAAVRHNLDGLIDGLMVSRELGLVSRARFVLLLEHEGWRFENGEIAGEDDVVRRYTELSEQMEVLLEDVLSRGGL